MTYNQWLRKHKPVDNTITDAAYDGKMFETFGPELAFVKAADPAKVWTLVEVDGRMFIIDGLHLANRIGYFVTEVVHTGEPIEIKAG